jgi:hypothetical protein
MLCPVHIEKSSSPAYKTKKPGAKQKKGIVDTHLFSMQKLQQFSQSRAKNSGCPRFFMQLGKSGCSPIQAQFKPQNGERPRFLSISMPEK